MNAKETLKRLAEALNISTEPTVEDTTEQTAEVEAAPEKVEETVEAVVEEVKEEVIEEPVVSEESEVKQELPIETEVKEDARVAELEKQLQDLKDILKKTIESPVQEAVTAPIDDKGLTHSPEKPIDRKHTKIGKKGGDTMSRVFKYINN